MQGIIVFIIVFFVVVTVHEFGHFLVAKKSGILCQEFAIGFGPKVFHKKIGETNFTVRLLPIGGYVKMPDNVFDFNNEVSPYDIKKGMNIYLKLDEDNKVQKILLDVTNDVDAVKIQVNDCDLTYKLFIEGYSNGGETLEKFLVKDDACVVFSGMEEQIAPINRMFSSHSCGKKIATLFAGPFMNFVLAACIFVGISMVNGVPVDKPIIGGIIDNSPAYNVGLKSNDVIKKINDNEIKSWNEIRNKVQETNGNELRLIIEREGRTLEYNINPKKETLSDKNGNLKNTYTLGIKVKYEKNLMYSIKYGLKQTLYYGGIIFMGIVGLFISLIKGIFSLNQLGGPVAIYEMSSEVAKNGLESTLRWIGILSVNLGLMNLIPIPVLDGGRIVFVLYEAIFKKPINKKAQYYITIVFALLLLILTIAVTWNDISRLLK